MKTTIGIIGGGNMGAAIMSGIRKNFSVKICERDLRRVKYLRQAFRVVCQDLKTIVKGSKIIILAVKPQDFEEILSEISPEIRQGQLVISIAAGITSPYIEKRLKRGTRVIRTMPNLPAQVGQGMTAICKGKFASKFDVALAKNIFNHVGKTVVVEEKWMDSVTAISGSGPAYVFLFVECLMKAAQSLGFKENLSKELILQTIKGSLTLLERQSQGPAILRARVTSKGGTTQAAMDVFMKKNIEQIFKQALLAAQKKAKELARN